MLKKGYIQVYTGNGKGKSTAAIGLLIRALGAGMRVLFAQFLKSNKSCEHYAFKRYLPMVNVKQYAKGFIIGKKPSHKDVVSARKGLEELIKFVSSGEYDLIVLDEANVATHLGIIRVEDLLSLIDKKHPKTELIITGRHADPRITQRADLVTEMKEEKHYFQKGVKARKGIEQ